ncbi:hypothetical protein L6452_06896 [Arctium lappa]|uniref:Uncharacterized protein n=1 Tax=Arctium lappa TaxID=4217 RepID=A0ACB9EJQ4_ARCLA|nr:hypothetical protein L6452_06896 [Arctium lappa]
MVILDRSNSSYPDLRQKSLRVNVDNRLRAFDDVRVGKQYSLKVNNHSSRIEGRKENIYRSKLVSGDIRHRPRRCEAVNVYSRVEGSIEFVPNVSCKGKYSVVGMRG